MADPRNVQSNFLYLFPENYLYLLRFTHSFIQSCYLADCSFFDLINIIYLEIIIIYLIFLIIFVISIVNCELFLNYKITFIAFSNHLNLQSYYQIYATFHFEFAKFQFQDLK